MTTERSSRGSRRAAALALCVVLAAATVSAHRRDEYLQAARVAIDPGRVELQLDLTPGIALAASILADIDRNGDGSLSADEQRAYTAVVMSALQLDVDGTALQLQSRDASFPVPEAVRQGEGTIRLQTAAALPPLVPGFHQLTFHNRHDASRSVYLANALVPATDRVSISAQRRDFNQSELTIDYFVRPGPPTAAPPSLAAGLAVMMALCGFVFWLARHRRAGGHEISV